jgi:hypothetical protein
MITTIGWVSAESGMIKASRSSSAGIAETTTW